MKTSKTCPKDPEREEKILQTALRLFRKKGIAKVSMDDISIALGMSKKTLYVIFSDKGDLVRKIIDDIFQRHFAYIETHDLKEISAPEKIQAIYKYGIKEVIQFEPIFFFDLEKFYPVAYLQYKTYRRKLIFNHIKNILEDAQINGEIDKSINIDLFCELNLLQMDRILYSSSLSKTYAPDILMNHTIGINLKGLLK